MKDLGKRISRGLFKTYKGILLNVDLNMSYHGMKKAFPNVSSADGITAFGLKSQKYNRILLTMLFEIKRVYKFPKLSFRKPKLKISNDFR